MAVVVGVVVVVGVDAQRGGMCGSGGVKDTAHPHDANSTPQHTHMMQTAHPHDANSTPT